MSDIENRVLEVVAKKMELDPDKIKLDARFGDDLGADSLDLVELVMELETKFNIEIPDSDAEKIVKVSDAVEYIQSKIEKVD